MNLTKLLKESVVNDRKVNEVTDIDNGKGVPRTQGREVKSEVTEKSRRVYRDGDL